MGKHSKTEERRTFFKIFAPKILKHAKEPHFAKIDHLRCKECKISWFFYRNLRNMSMILERQGITKGKNQKKGIGMGMGMGIPVLAAAIPLIRANQRACRNARDWSIGDQMERANHRAHVW
jgi:hypothetical protein